MPKINNWDKIEADSWKHESGKFYISIYNMGEWYADIFDEKDNLGTVSYTALKADGLRNVGKILRYFETVDSIQTFIKEHHNLDWARVLEKLIEEKEQN